MSLLAPYDLPFVLALMGLALIALLQVTGLGDMLEGDADAAGGLVAARAKPARPAKLAKPRDNDVDDAEGIEAAE